MGTVAGVDEPDRAHHRRKAPARAYTTPAELADLEATVDRYPEERTREVRSFIVAQRLRARETSWSHLHHAG